MVAYGFRPRFAAPILAGTKTQTIRAPRIWPARHAEPGEALQLYTGMRTKQCKLITRAQCIGRFDVVLNLTGEDVELCSGAGEPGARLAMFIGPDRLAAPGVVRRKRLDEFARMDGFEDWRELRAWWSLTHPGVNRFDGSLIRWVI